MRRALLVVWCFLPLAGCVNQSEVYAPPMQRRPMAGPDTSRLRHFIAMNDPHAADHFLRDISPTLESGLWRWTGQRPLLRFVLPSTRGLKFAMDFSISDQTFAATGPLTVTFFVNTHQLDRVTYPKAGEQHFEKAVPQEWLNRGDNVASAELDKVWTAPDGVKLGLTLVRAGFRE